MPNQPDQFTATTTVAIVGVGLIGGSIAAALKSRQHRGRVVGVGRNAERLQSAVSVKLIDEYVTDLRQVRADLTILCTPVDHIVSNARKIAANNSQTAIFTDAGSVKEQICTDLSAELPGRFVGSHPLAGSEKRGFEYADAELFVDRLCVITPTKTTPENRTEFIEQFWRSIGMRTLRMSPAEHDAALAQTSHLPHLVASVLAGCLPSEWLKLTSTGFADTTRIAAGDADLWTAILLQNRAHVLAACERFESTWREFRNAIETTDAVELKQLLVRGKTVRDAMTND